MAPNDISSTALGRDVGCVAPQGGAGGVCPTGTLVGMIGVTVDPRVVCSTRISLPGRRCPCAAGAETGTAATTAAALRWFRGGVARLLGVDRRDMERVA
jgi:hypothetical protein